VDDLAQAITAQTDRIIKVPGIGKTAERLLLNSKEQAGRRHESADVTNG
jgi:Holliday junction resolvasome RuvABC DNA-binding subunit